MTFVDVTSVVKAEGAGRARSATDAMTGLQLRQVIAQVLASHTAERPNSVSFDGPAILLSPRGMLAIGIIAHDLARQSAESGALSVASGQVRVDWRIEQAADGPALTWNWTEAGVPAQAAPLDASLVQSYAEHELQGHATIATEPDGRRVTLAMKLQAIGVLQET